MIFNKLSETQLAVFEQIACGDDTCHPEQTLRSLEKRGLIESYHQEEYFGILKFNVVHYRVPVHVHIEWCQWCSEELEGD